MNISEKIEYIRKQKGVKKSHIAWKCGKTPAWYTDISKGLKKVHVDDLEKIADALDVNISIFFSKDLSEALKTKEKDKEVS